MKEEHHKKMDTLIERIAPSLHKALDKALASGCLSEEDKDSTHFLLTKAVFTVYMRSNPYGPLSDEQRSLVDNLEYFI